MIDAAIRVNYLHYDEFNIGLILLEVRARETGIFIQSLEKNPYLWCYIASDQTGLFCYAYTEITKPKEIMVAICMGDYS